MTLPPPPPPPLPPKNNNWRTLIVNANSVVSGRKRAQFANLVDYPKQDAIIVTETKLAPDFKSADFMPPGYSNPLCKDCCKGERGVLVAVRDIYTCTALDLPPTDADFVWGEVHLKQGQNLYIGSFYRTPSGDAKKQMEDLHASLASLRGIAGNKHNTNIILGDDFNFGDINWEQEDVNTGAQNISAGNHFIDMLREFHLTQTQREPTRGAGFLDLHITSRPTLVKTTTVVPGIFDHDGAIVVDSTQSPVIDRKSPRKVFVFSKARWLKMKEDVQSWSQGFIRALYDHTVEDNWKKLKSHLNDTMPANIPTKMTSTKWHQP